MNAPSPTAAMMSGEAYRDSLRRLRPTVFVDGRRVESVADDPSLRPGVNAIALTYDYALTPRATAACVRTNRPTWTATCISSSEMPGAS